MTIDDKQNYVICSLCHRPTPEGKLYCQYCWTRLASDTVVNAAEAREYLQKAEAAAKRKKKIRWVAITLGAVILVAMVTMVALSKYTDVLDKSFPTLNSDSPAGQWSMFRHDLSHSGATDSTGATPQGQVQWTFPTGGAVESSPAIVDGIVYFGSQDGKIYAVDAASGSEKWEFQTESFVQSSPTVVDGVLYVGSNDGRMLALDAGTGNLIWAYRTPYPVTSSAAVVDGIVYFGSDDFNLYALDALTGRLLWKFQTGHLVAGSPVVADGIVYIGSFDGNMYALDAKTGKFRLHFASLSIDATAVVSGNTVYCNNVNGYLFAINGRVRNWPYEQNIRPFWIQLWAMHLAPQPPQTSGLIWSVKLGQSSHSSPALANNTLYLGIDLSLVAVDARNHGTLWSFPTGNMVESSPAVLGNTVYFGSDDGKIYAVDATSGKELWDVITGGKVISSPALANGILYVGSDDGKLYAIK